MIWLPIFFLKYCFWSLSHWCNLPKCDWVSAWSQVEDTCLGWCKKKYWPARTVRLAVDSILRPPGSLQGPGFPPRVWISPLGKLNSNSL